MNRPGAGSLTAANFLYNGAPKDGATIAHFNRSVPLEPLMGNAAAKFDGRRFTWLGSVGNEVSVCVGWHASAVQNWNDLITKEFIAGAAGMGADTGVFPLVLRNVFGAKIKIITGYPGGGEMNLAMEKGEIDGRCGWSWSGVKSTKPDWLTGKQINILAQLALQKSPELPGVPLVVDQATNDEQREILKIVFSRQEFAWPFAAPPDIPADRRQALRNAFAADAPGPGVLGGRQEDSDRCEPGFCRRGRKAHRRSLRDAGGDPGQGTQGHHRAVNLLQPSLHHLHHAVTECVGLWSRRVAQRTVDDQHREAVHGGPGEEFCGRTALLGEHAGFDHAVERNT